MATKQRPTSQQETLNIVRRYRPDPQRQLRALHILLDASCKRPVTNRQPEVSEVTVAEGQYSIVGAREIG